MDSETVNNKKNFYFYRLRDIKDLNSVYKFKEMLELQKYFENENISGQFLKGTNLFVIDRELVSESCTGLVKINSFRPFLFKPIKIIFAKEGINYGLDNLDFLLSSSEPPLFSLGFGKNSTKFYFYYFEISAALKNLKDYYF